MKRTCKQLIALLLVAVIMLPTIANAESMSDYYANSASEHLNSAHLAEEMPDPADIFNIITTPGKPYDGFLFHLVDGATFSLEESVYVRAISLTVNLFHAATVQDIINFVAPELIVFIEPNYRMSIGPLPTIEPVPIIATPHAFASVNDPYYPAQWCLEFIRGAAAWAYRAATL